MESLEIAHKLLQLITRTLIQMITLNRKLWNPLLSLSFLFFSCLCARMCVSLCVKMHCCFVHFARVCQWRGGVLWKGQRSVTPWRTDRAKAASPTLPPVPPPSPWAVMGCLRGWRFPWQLAAFCAPRVMQGGLLKVAREGCTKWYWVEQPHELHEQGKQLSAITHHVSLFFSPSFLLINTRPWLKQQREPNEPPFAYTCCVKSEPTPECEFTLTWSC